MRQGQVRAGIAGFHPGLQVDLVPGDVHTIQDNMWSDALFEPVAPVADMTTEPPPVWRRSRPATDAVKED